MTCQIRSLPSALTLVVGLTLAPSLAHACPGHGSMRPSESTKIDLDEELVLEVDAGDDFVEEEVPADLTFEASNDSFIPNRVSRRKRLRQGRRPLSRTFIYRRWPTRLRGPMRLAYVRPDTTLVDPRIKERVYRARMDSRRLAKILGALEDEPFGDDKLEIIKEAAERMDLSTSQAMALVEQLTFDDDKVQALVSLYPSIVDTENFIESYSLLTFSSSRKDLRRRIRALDNE